MDTSLAVTASTTLPAAVNVTRSTGTFRRRPSSRARSTDTPTGSPVFASLLARIGLPKLIAARRRPSGASARTTSAVLFLSVAVFVMVVQAMRERLIEAVTTVAMRPSNLTALTVVSVVTVVGAPLGAKNVRQSKPGIAPRSAPTACIRSPVFIYSTLPMRCTTSAIFFASASQYVRNAGASR